MSTFFWISGAMCAVLGMMFIVLRLCGLIHWSWWFVLMPVYVPVVFVAVVMAVGFVLYVKNGDFIPY